MKLYYFILMGFLIADGYSLPQQIRPYKEKTRVDVFPETQNTPSDAALSHLRPPKPVVPNGKDSSIFIGLSSFRDGIRCGKTIFTGIKRARNPSRITFGIVDQMGLGDKSCLDSYCELAREEWKGQGDCPHKSQIRIDYRTAADSRGPTLARHYQQNLIEKEEFCLQLDSHSIFTNKWDDFLYENWLQADNEMAVLSTYLHHIHNFVDEKGDNHPPKQLPLLCKTIRGTNGLVRNNAASMLFNSRMPQMVALWGAGLSFNKCHAEKRVRVDSHTLWMFDGEEFLRSSHLWTYGYDIYAPSILGAVVYHNYSKVPQRFEHIRVDPRTKLSESKAAINRFKKMVGMNYTGEVNEDEMDLYGFGSVRSFEQYLEFSGVSLTPNTSDRDTCHQLHWVPYSDPAPVEELLPGWKMNSPQRVLPSEKHRLNFFAPDSQEQMGNEIEARRPEIRSKLLQALKSRTNTASSWYLVKILLGLITLATFLGVYLNKLLWIKLRRAMRPGRTSKMLGRWDSRSN